MAWLLRYALEARGATARKRTWSGLAIRTFPGMFSADGRGFEVLCTDISATNSSERVLRCIGALPHLDPWLSHVGAIADALIALCHPPGGDASVPSMDFMPAFGPNDEACGGYCTPLMNTPKGGYRASNPKEDMNGGTI